MRAVVVYESHWGNTAAVARAVAEGMGGDAVALSTGEATAEALAGVELVVAGAPVLGFNLPTEQMREGMRTNPGRGAPPDLSQPLLREWLEAMPKGTGRSAAFETRIWWSPGGATKAILEKLQAAGYAPLGAGERFIVKGRYGPLRGGELERARAWGAQLAQSL